MIVISFSRNLFFFFLYFFIWNKVNNKDKIEESKEKGNKIIKNNSNNNSINFNDIETTDLNIFKLIENKIKNIIELLLPLLA